MSDVEINKKLIVEATFVGITFIPFQMIAENFFPNRMTATFVAGFSYHIASQMIGLNEWFVKHSSATDALNKRETMEDNYYADYDFRQPRTMMTF